MIPSEARTLAQVLYYGRVDWSSLPEFDHLARVARNVEHDDAKVVAWLHDAIEDGLVSLAALKPLIDEAEYNALFLLTRIPGEETYLDYIRCIALAEGRSGEIAREVKLADNADNCNRPCPADKMDMRQPGGRYDKARKILEGKHA